MLHTQLTFWSSSHSWNSWSTFHQGWASLVAQRGKRLPAMRQTRVWCFGPEDPLEKEMATQCNTLSWKVPWTEEPGRLRYSPWGHGSQRVGHCWATSLSFFLFSISVAPNLGKIAWFQGGSAPWWRHWEPTGRTRASPGKCGERRLLSADREQTRPAAASIRRIGSQRVRHYWAANTFTHLRTG